MQNHHPISEDVEPPSTGGRRSDLKGCRTSKSTVAHDPIHGRGFILKTYRFKKNRIETENPLSSRFAPFIYRTAEINSQLADRAGLFEEDDEYPPSAYHGAEFRSTRLSGNIELREYLGNTSGIPLYFSIADSVPWKHTGNLPSGSAARAIPCHSQDDGGRPSTFRLHSPSFVSWFRCVPTGRLSPPGIVSQADTT
jgi:hypothetical protein